MITYISKAFQLCIVGMFFGTPLMAQDSTYSSVDASVRNTYETCLAFYPSLPSKQIKVKKRKQLIPLTTIPSVWNLFRQKKKWTYTINISTKTIDKLSPILFDSLSSEAQVGVLSHELSHVLDFHSNSKSYLIKVFFSHLSKRRMDNFEFNTDNITIKQGAGVYLLQWSEEVRENLALEAWKGKESFKREDQRERYMSPATICNRLHELPQIYSSLPKNCNTHTN